MYRPRIIPVLLLHNKGLVKSIRFNKYRYIGDPINAVKIFNDKKADEIIFLDIDASKENRLISIDFVKKVGNEANMPFAVGGGIKSMLDIRKILKGGAEKVVLNTSIIENPSFIKESADYFGSSTISVCLDTKKNIFGNYLLYYKNGRIKAKKDLIEFTQICEEYGAGEIIIQSIDNDGMLLGYDIELVKKISMAVSIPVVALGGANGKSDLKNAVIEGYASAVAAGSMFVYHGPRNAVLINYPSQKEITNIFL